MINTTTVGALKAQLDSFPDDLPAVSCVSFGDRLNTMQAIAVGELEVGGIETTGYSDSGYAVTEDATDLGEVLILNFENI